MNAIDTKDKVLSILTEVTENEYKKIFTADLSPDEKLQLLTTESMLALIFVTSIEDEFSIEFDDDDVDMNFFKGIDVVVQKIEQYI